MSAVTAVVIRGARDLSLQTVQTAAPGPGDVVIAPAYVGVCGSDLHYYADGAVGRSVIREPLIPGHELSGTVIEGSGSFEPGTRITVHPATWGSPAAGLEDRRELWSGGRYLGSAATLPHTQGAMVERMVVREDQLRVLPETLPLRRAALAEPLAVALHGIAQGPRLQGRKVLVSGSGPIGLLAAAAARIFGAEVTSSDMLPGPLARAALFGASTLRIGVDEIPADAFDVVLECAGVPAALQSALNAVKPAGTIVQVGMLADEARPLNLSRLVLKEVTVAGSYRFDTEFDAAIELLADHPEFDQVITHEFGIADAMAAFEVAADSDASGKVLIKAG